MSRGKPSYVSHIQTHVLTNTIFATHILIISINCRIHPTSEAIQVKVVCSFLGGSFQCVRANWLGSTGRFERVQIHSLVRFQWQRAGNPNVLYVFKASQWRFLDYFDLNAENHQLALVKKKRAIACLILIGYVTDCLPVICYMTRVEDW